MDKRKQNGGHSTKAVGVDKRKNEYKDAISLAGSVEDVVEVLRMLFEKATGEKKDTQAAGLYLSYMLGKPIETKEIEVKGEQKIFNITPID